MANYVLLNKRGDPVKFFDNLPKSWENTSGIHLLEQTDENELNLRGFYKLRKVPVPIDFDSKTQYISGYDYRVVVDKNLVREVPIIANYTPEEISSREISMSSSFWDHLRQVRNRLLQECDWTQIPDVKQLRTVEWVDAWKTYRQQLRDLPLLYVNYKEYLVADIVWPIKPDLR